MAKNGGIISGGFQPLKAPDAPTIDSVTAGVLQADVEISAPENAGDGTISSYVVSAKQSDGTSVSNTSASAGTVSLTLTAGGTTTFSAQAISQYGPGAFSGYGNSTPILSGQELFGIGKNEDGELGLGDIVNRSSPVQIGTETTWDTFNTYRNSTYAVRGGALYSWGDNRDSRLGYNTGDISSPTQVGALTNWKKAVGLDLSTAIAVKTDGTLWGWGDNSDGEIGTNNRTSYQSPVQVGSDTDWVDVSANGSLSMAKKSDGSLYLWGLNTWGQVGDNTVIARSSPVQLGSDTDWNVIESGGNMACAIKTDGTLWSWGRNEDGELGQGDTVYRSSPVQVGALTNWTEVSSYGRNAMALTSGNALYVMGRGSSGRNGNNSGVSLSSPTQISGTWTAVGAGAGSNFAVDDSSNLWIIGGDSLFFGVAGDRYRSSPVQISNVTNAFKISASSSIIYTEAVE